jgi:hypothetical protein
MNWISEYRAQRAFLKAYVHEDRMDSIPVITLLSLYFVQISVLFVQHNHSSYEHPVPDAYFHDQFQLNNYVNPLTPNDL